MTQTIETLNQYEQAARRTEPEVTDEMRRRFKIAHEDLRELLKHLVDLSIGLDALKRFIYYGDSETINKLFNENEIGGYTDFFYHYPVEEDAQRTEDEDRAISRHNWAMLSNDRLNASIHVFHAILGMAGEVGEIAADMSRVFEGDHDRSPVLVSLDSDKLDNQEIEGGDVLWYLPQLVRGLNAARAISGALPVYRTSFAKMASATIEKLKARFPGKFSEADAINRDVEAEMHAADKYRNES